MEMTKKMLAVALMLSSVVVLAGCNKTPAEPVEEMTGDVVVVDEATGTETPAEPVEEMTETETPTEEIVVDAEPVEEMTETETHAEDEVVVEQPVEVVTE